MPKISLTLARSLAETMRLARKNLARCASRTGRPCTASSLSSLTAGLSFGSVPATVAPAPAFCFSRDRLLLLESLLSSLFFLFFLLLRSDASSASWCFRFLDTVSLLSSEDDLSFLALFADPSSLSRLSFFSFFGVLIFLDLILASSDSPSPEVEEDDEAIAEDDEGVALAALRRSNKLPRSPPPPTQMSLPLALASRSCRCAPMPLLSIL